MFDPWRLVTHLQGWIIIRLPLTTRGLTSWPDRTIVLDPMLTAAEERAALTHEIVHALRGPVPRWLAPREETVVRATAARLLIDVVHLEDAAAWSRHPLVVAELLDVDEATVLARIELLSPAERARIDARLETIHLP